MCLLESELETLGVSTKVFTATRSAALGDLTEDSITLGLLVLVAELITVRQEVVLLEVEILVLSITELYKQEAEVGVLVQEVIRQAHALQEITPLVLPQIIVQEAEWGAIAEPTLIQVILLEELRVMELEVAIFRDTPQEEHLLSQQVLEVQELVPLLALVQDQAVHLLVREVAVAEEAEKDNGGYL